MSAQYRGDPDGNMADLAERLRDAAQQLRIMADEARGPLSELRLNGKRAGVLLALDYIRAYEEQS